MQRFSYTGKQDEEFHQNGKYSQIVDFEYWNFCIAYKSVWAVVYVVFSLNNWLFTYNDFYFLQKTTLIKCVHGSTQSHLLQSKLFKFYSSETQ